MKVVKEATKNSKIGLDKVITVVISGAQTAVARLKKTILVVYMHSLTMKKSVTSEKAVA